MKTTVGVKLVVVGFDKFDQSVTTFIDDIHLRASVVNKRHKPTGLFLVVRDHIS